MMTTGTVVGPPVGFSANVHVVPAAVPALMMPGAPLNGTRTTVFVPRTCSASVCAGPALTSVTLPSPVQVASIRPTRGLLLGAALAPLTTASDAATMNKNRRMTLPSVEIARADDRSTQGL